MTSIRRKLLATLLVAITTVSIAAGAVVYRLTRQEIDAVFDYHLRQIALSLRDQALAGRTPVISAPSPELELVIQIWDADGEKLFGSGGDRGLPEVAELGFATVGTPSGAWRVFSADVGDQVVQVAQPLPVRQRATLAAAFRTLAPIVIALPLLAFLVWRIVGLALAPLDRLARAVGARTPNALEPIPEQGAPAEAVPLVRALNGLLERLASVLSAQRAFVADAAHELRTPLAGLQLQLQLVERSADEQERTAVVAQLRRGLERTAHVVQQLLTLAREEPGVVRRPASAPVALGELADQVVADHALMAEAKQVDLGVVARDDGVIVHGDPVALRTLLANLVDNAVRYTPPGGRVDVSVGTDGGRAFVDVADTGPGIPVQDRERVFDRFFRRADASQPGAGLGLAIVRAIARRHGAEIRLEETPGGGLTVRAMLPLLDPAT